MILGSMSRGTLDKSKVQKLKDVNQYKRFVREFKTFQLVEDGIEISNEYQKIPYHFVFDVKFDLRRKACLVAGGN